MVILNIVLSLDPLGLDPWKSTGQSEFDYTSMCPKPPFHYSLLISFLENKMLFKCYSRKINRYKGFFIAVSIYLNLNLSPLALLSSFTLKIHG